MLREFLSDSKLSLKMNDKASAVILGDERILP